MMLMDCEGEEISEKVQAEEMEEMLGRPNKFTSSTEKARRQVIKFHFRSRHRERCRVSGKIQRNDN